MIHPPCETTHDVEGLDHESEAQPRKENILPNLLRNAPSTNACCAIPSEL